jgi:hypothetical protein
MVSIEWSLWTFNWKFDNYSSLCIISCRNNCKTPLFEMLLFINCDRPFWQNPGPKKVLYTQHKNCKQGLVERKVQGPTHRMCSAVPLFLSLYKSAYLYYHSHAMTAKLPTLYYVSPVVWIWTNMRQNTSMEYGELDHGFSSIWLSFPLLATVAKRQQKNSPFNLRRFYSTAYFSAKFTE